MSEHTKLDAELIDALAAAYALVAAADRDLAEIELGRLRNWGKEAGFSGADLSDLQDRARGFAAGLVNQAGENRVIALARVRALAGDDQRAGLVLAAARVAVVADERVVEAEEDALREIAGALGLDPLGA